MDHANYVNYFMVLCDLTMMKEPKSLPKPKSPSLSLSSA